MSKNPLALRGKVKESGCDGGLGHGGLAHSAHLRPVTEGAKGHRAIG